MLKQSKKTKKQMIHEPTTVAEFKQEVIANDE